MADAARVAAFHTEQAGQNVWLYLYRLENPASGTNTITINTSGISGGERIDYSIVEYTGVDQTSMAEVSNTVTQASGTTLTIPVTTLTDNAWLAGCMRNASSGSITSAGAGTIKRNGLMVDSDGAKSPAGSHSLIGNVNNSRSAGIVAALKPAVGNSIAYVDSVADFGADNAASASKNFSVSGGSNRGLLIQVQTNMPGGDIVTSVTGAQASAAPSQNPLFFAGN
jgi:hypothetical protein